MIPDLSDSTVDEIVEALVNKHESNHKMLAAYSEMGVLIAVKEAPKTIEHHDTLRPAATQVMDAIITVMKRQLNQFCNFIEDLDHVHQSYSDAREKADEYLKKEVK